jgi:hypothetical protein
MDQAIKIGRKVARRVLEVVDAGLSNGLGNPVPGEMCVEAAVCYALGLPHGDDPKCVGKAVRAFKIRLNDSRWSSNAARAKGLQRLAVAQLGSDKIDQKEFSVRLAIETVRQVLPIALVTAKIQDEVIQACRDARTLEEAREAAVKAKEKCYAANAAAYAAANAAAYAAAYAAYAADAAAYAAADAAARKAGTKLSDPDMPLFLIADIAVGILKQLKSPGCKYLDLCEEAS